MQAYRSKDLERLLGVSPSGLRSLIRSARISPGRGPRGVLQFSFRDVVMMRTVRSLIAAKVPARRIRRNLEALRIALPESAPLSGLSITAVGDRVAVRQGATQWEGASGQYLLAFEVKGEGADIRFIEAPMQPAEPSDCQTRFEAALRLERSNPEEALASYRECIGHHSAHVEAYVNAGRLLHAAGRLLEAARMYRDAPEPSATLLFNLAILLEDLGEEADARAAYQKAIELDAAFADAHFNLARLYEIADDRLMSLRHFSAYWKLLRE